MMRKRPDFILLGLAAASYGLSWYAHNAMKGSIALRSQLYGVGKAMTLVFMVLFVVDLVRRRKPHA